MPFSSRSTEIQVKRFLSKLQSQIQNQFKNLILEHSMQDKNYFSFFGFQKDIFKVEKTFIKILRLNSNLEQKIRLETSYFPTDIKSTKLGPTRSVFQFID